MTDYHDEVSDERRRKRRTNVIDEQRTVTKDSDDVNDGDDTMWATTTENKGNEGETCLGAWVVLPGVPKSGVEEWSEGKKNGTGRRRLICMNRLLYTMVASAPPNATQQCAGADSHSLFPTWTTVTTACYVLSETG
jgi:hypothetical protein